MDIILAALCVGLGLVVVYFFRKSKETSEYKELFELSDHEYKKSQETIQALLHDKGTKDVLLDRSSQALDLTNNRIRDLEGEKLTLQQSLEYQQEQYAKLIGQKKSSEVRTGKIAEQMAPFLENYPLPPKTAHFLGDPIDFVHFDEDRVTFVEVKSGKSQLSKKQRQIRDMIAEGKVEFIIYRVEGENK